MTAIIFDTLKFVKKLKTAGMPEKQANALSEALQDTHLEANLATKNDIKELELKVHTELLLLKWMLSFLLAGTLALVTRAFLM